MLLGPSSIVGTEFTRYKGVLSVRWSRAESRRFIGSAVGGAREVRPEPSTPASASALDVVAAGVAQLSPRHDTRSRDRAASVERAALSCLAKGETDFCTSEYVPEMLIFTGQDRHASLTRFR